MASDVTKIGDHSVWSRLEFCGIANTSELASDILSRLEFTGYLSVSFI